MASFCVFCASASDVESVYVDATKELGRKFAERQHMTVYGGCNVGLMHILADSALQAGGRVTGIIPKFLHKAGLSFEKCNKLIVAEDMRDRKATMEKMSDGFVILPGGFGTLEEFFEMVTHKQLSLFDKPIILLNIDGFYDPLLKQFEVFFAQKFARTHYRSLYQVCSSVDETLECLENYETGKLVLKY